MKRLASIIALILSVTAWVAITACQSTVIQTPTRSFDRPSDVALSCVKYNSSYPTPTYEVHPVAECNPNVAAFASDMGLQTTPNLGPNPNINFLVTLTSQTARGEVAFADTAQNKLIDLDPIKPGFGFVPVGSLPEHLRTSTDGCWGYTANSGSCDLSRLDINTLINHSQEIEHTGSGHGRDLAYDDLAVGSDRITPYIMLPNGQRRVLGARPSWIEMAPDFDGSAAIHGYEQGGTPGVCGGTSGTRGRHRAWVAYPGCQLVAKVALEPDSDYTGGLSGLDDWSTAGRIEQAIQVTRSGATVVTDLSTIQCASECGAVVGPDGGVPSDLALPPPPDLASGDAGTTLPLPTTRAAPTTLAIDFGDSPNAGRMIIGDALGEALTVVPMATLKTPASHPADPTDGLGTPVRIPLETGALGVTVVRVAPRSPAGKFVYAIARDASVRVVDLDQQLECETNVSPLFKNASLNMQSTLQMGSDGKPVGGLDWNEDPQVKARLLGCFPVNAQTKTLRRADAHSPGITLAPGQLPSDIAFVHVGVPPGTSDNNSLPPPAAPGFLVGDFAWILSSDGHGVVVQIFDDCPQPDQQDINNATGPWPNLTKTGQPTMCIHGVFTDSNNTPHNLSEQSVGETQLLYGHPLSLLYDRLSHRIRGGHPRFQQPLAATDTTGMARLYDELNPPTVAVPSTSANDGGVSDAGISAGLPTLYAEPIPQNLNVPPAGISAQTFTIDPAVDRRITFTDPDHAENETWTLAWEGLIPGTDRTLGHPFVDPTDGKAKLTDSGGAWCQRGVLDNDKLVITGCIVDDDCNQAEVTTLDGGASGYVDGGHGLKYHNFKCVHDPTAPADIFSGLCLVEDTQRNDQYWSDACGTLLRSQRKYKIAHARQSVPVAGEGLTDVLELQEIYEPEFPQQTHTCSADADCIGLSIPASDGTSVLATKCLADNDGVNRCLVPCDTKADTRCGTDFECAPSTLGGDRCMRGPVDANLWKTCFPELLNYQVQAGSSFLISGNLTGFLFDSSMDANNECFATPVPASPTLAEYTRLRNARIPLEPAATCPASTVTDPLTPIDQSQLLGTNICRIDSVPGSELVHFENNVYNIALQVPKQGLDGTLIVPPDGTTISFSVIGGGNNLLANLGVDVQAQQPRYAVVAPDQQTVYVVDEGSNNVASGLRGQLLRLFTPTQSVDTLFVIR